MLSLIIFKNKSILSNFERIACTQLDSKHLVFAGRGLPYLKRRPWQSNYVILAHGRFFNYVGYTKKAAATIKILV